MTTRRPFLNTLLTFLIFLILEGLAFLLISRNSIIQQYRLMESFRHCQAFFWEQGESIKYFFSLKQINQSLVEENRVLMNELLRSNSSKEVANPFVADTTNFRFITAKVVKNSVNKQHNSIVLDKGKVDGIKEYMGVITPNGIIGHIHSVGEHYSLVTSFLDIGHNVSALIKSNNTFGPIRWDGRRSDMATLVEIPLHTDIIVGDTIVTSGYSTIYPPGIPMGAIVSSKLVDGINYHITVRLFENFSTLRYVYIVENKSQLEIDSLIKQKENN